jgi:hypothetical protein
MDGEEYSADEDKEPSERRRKDESLMRVHTCPGLVDQIGSLRGGCLGSEVRFSSNAGGPHEPRIGQATAADIAAGVEESVGGFRDPLSPSSGHQPHQFGNGEANENSRSVPAALLGRFLEDNQHLCREHLSIVSWVELEQSFAGSPHKTS